jgi:streptogramin lyase
VPFQDRRRRLGSPAWKVLLAALALVALTPASSQAFALQEVGGLNSPATGIAVNVDGNVWAAEEAAESVVRVSPSGEIVGRIPVGGEPFGIAAGPGGRIWATLPESHELVWFDATSPTPTAHHISTGPAKCGPAAIANGGDGSMYFTMPYEDGCTIELGHINSDGTGFASTPNAAGNSYDIAIINGRLYTPDFDHNLVRRVALNDLTDVKAAVSTPPLTNPSGVAVDGSGRVWVTLESSGQLAYFPVSAPDGSSATVLTPTGGTLVEPFGIVAGLEEKMYTAGANAQLLTATALPTFAFTPLPAGSEPWDIANDGSGGLWVTDLANTRLLHLYNPPPPNPSSGSGTTAAPVVTVKPAPKPVTKLSLSGKSKQKLGSFVQLKVSCSVSPCSVSATGALKIELAGKGATTQPKLTAVKNLQVPAGKQAVLKLKIPPRAEQAAAKALDEKGGKASAKISVQGKGAAGKSPGVVFKVKLKK